MTEPLDLEHSEVSLQPIMKAFTFEVTKAPSGVPLGSPQKHLATVLCTCVYIGKETLLQSNQVAHIASVRLHCVAEVILQNNQTLMMDVQAKEIQEDITEDLTEGSAQVEICDTLEASDKQTGETN